MRLNRTGFSLMELLMVVSLLPIISLAVFGNLSSGFRIWKAMGKESSTEDTSIFYQKSKKDFLNMTPFTGFPFIEDGGKISFMTLIETDAALGGNRGIGQVTYSYDSSKRMIIREQKNMHDLYEDHEGQKSAVLKSVKYFKPLFLVYEKSQSAYVWKDTWEDPQGKKLPVAVQFQIELLSAGEAISMTKTYKIPAGGE